MNKKDYNNLLINLGVFERKHTEQAAAVQDEDHYTDLNGINWEIAKGELSEDEIQTVLMAKQTLYLKSIKDVITGLAVVTVIGVILIFFL